MDVLQPLVQTMALPNTLIAGKLQSTTGTSVNSTQTSFARTSAANAIDVPINEDYFFDAPQIICSKVNESNQSTLGGNKSFRLAATLTSTSNLVSPIIDTSRMGAICIKNRTNDVDSLSDIGSLTPYLPMTTTAGDPNKAIYMTKRVSLAQGATALQVLFDGVVMSQSDIKVLYKTLRTDSAESFDDIEWTFFNPGATVATSGGPDSAVPLSKFRGDFKEYKYFVGRNSVGVGTELPDCYARNEFCITTGN